MKRIGRSRSAEMSAGPSAGWRWSVVATMGLVLAAAWLALGALAGCSAGGQTEGAPERAAGEGEVARNVRVLTLEKSDLDQFLTISGPVRALRGTDLAAEESGQVAEIAADKGTLVARDEGLIVLDRRMLAAELTSARANRELQEYNVERMRELHKANSVSEIELREAETRLRDAEARAEIAEIRHDRAAIRAPFDGLVVERYVELGQLVAPTMRVARIVDPYVLVLETGITEREIPFVQAGKQTEVLFDGLPGTHAGEVHWVGFEADPQTGKFPVEIYIPNPDRELRPGIVAHARILKERHRDILAIPRDAVVQRGSGPIAYVADSGRAYERRLRLGPDQGLMVIVEQGLSPGERLIVRGQREVRDSSAVAIQERAEARDGSASGDPDVVRQARTVPERWNGKQ